MARGSRSASLLWVVVVFVVAAVAVVTFAVVSHSVDNQNQALLQSQAGQVTQLLESAIAQQGTALTAMDAVAAATDASPSLFQAEAAPFTTMPNATVALVRSGRVLAVSGRGLDGGQAVPEPLASAIAHGSPRLFSTGVITVNGHQVLAEIVGGGPTGIAVVEMTGVEPSRTTPTASGPYKQINVALYASPGARPDQLIITTARPLPFADPVATTYVPVGTSKWAVVTAAKAPLAGAWPNALPWVLLVVGLLLAGTLGAVVGLLGRREEYANRLVAERTAELEASQRELVRRERLSAVGEMATMIGHELRNPLGAALNGLYLVRTTIRQPIPPDVDSYLTMTENQTGRAATLADDLTAYMRESDPDLVDVPFGDVADEVLEATPAPDGVDVAVAGRQVAVRADRLQLVQVLTNLVSNAYQVMPEGGSLRLSASANGEGSTLTVEDSGAGIAADQMDRLFDPFFTTRHDGTGLGLAIVRRLVEAHGGEVTASNRPGGGASFEIRLPGHEGRIAP
jgi:signal transduction histidine kinase